MLDDLNHLGELDPQNMAEHIYRLPLHCEEAASIAQDAIRGLRFHDLHNVVIAGLGGSAIGGNLLRMVIAGKTFIPINVHRDYKLPSYVDEKTLVIVSSYSGNTEETLSAYDDAVNRNAKILVITTGGILKQRALRDNVPHITVPSGISPRAAIGYSFFPLLVVMEELRIVPKRRGDIALIVENLTEQREELNPRVPCSQNPAKLLAKKIHGKLPIIYGVTGINDVVAERWKGQINENGKHPAFYNVFPELNHNEIMSYEGDQQLLKTLEIVILRNPDENDRIKKRIDVTVELIEGQVGGITQIMPKGRNPLAQMFYHIMYGDYVSFYLSILNAKNPTKIDLIDTLKERLEQDKVCPRTELPTSDSQ